MQDSAYSPLSALSATFHSTVEPDANTWLIPKENIMSKNKSVLGIYGTRPGVENAVSAFKDGGFSNSDISVLLPENLGSKEIATDKSSKAPEGATTGATSGAVLGGALGWLA